MRRGQRWVLVLVLVAAYFALAWVLVRAAVFSVGTLIIMTVGGALIRPLMQWHETRKRRRIREAMRRNCGEDDSL